MARKYKSGDVIFGVKNNAGKAPGQILANTSKRVFRYGGYVLPEGENAAANNLKKLDEYTAAKRQYVSHLTEIEKKQEQLTNEKTRVGNVRQKISDTALRALKDREFRKNFAHLNHPACTSVACVIDRMSGATLPDDVTVFGVPRRKNDRIPIIPGTSSWRNYAEKIGYDSLPYKRENTMPGDRIMWNDGFRGHTIIKVDGPEDNVYSTGNPVYIKSGYPVDQRILENKIPRIYRYVGNVPELTRKLEGLMVQKPHIPHYEIQRIEALPARVYPRPAQQAINSK